MVPMKSDAPERRRRSIRLNGYDYRQPGAYSITVLAHKRECLFGGVVDLKMELNGYGNVVRQCWEMIPAHFPHVNIDTFVVMPNHVHGILNGGARHAVPLHGTERFGQPVAGSIPTVIRSFKAAATRGINDLRRSFAITVWQRNYFEHVIRNDESLNHIRQYSLDNPARWEFDSENPLATRPESSEAWRTGQ
jgi:putative transposase